MVGPSTPLKGPISFYWLILFRKSKRGSKTPIVLKVIEMTYTTYGKEFIEKWKA